MDVLHQFMNAKLHLLVIVMKGIVRGAYRVYFQDTSIVLWESSVFLFGRVFSDNNSSKYVKHLCLVCVGIQDQRFLWD